jgi:zinc transporter ZupT
VSRSKWSEKLEQQQRNILPTDTIPNVAAVEGYIIRGDKRFTPVQRAGALVLGLVYSLPGLAGLAVAFLLASRADSSLSTGQRLVLSAGVLLVSAGWLYISTRMLLNPIRGGGKKHTWSRH